MKALIWLILMITCGDLKVGSIAYLTNYLERGETQGHWLGDGLGTVGLEDREPVLRMVAEHLGLGFAIDGETKLVQNAGVVKGPRKRNIGRDYTANCPKSVSLLWALNPALRSLIERAVDRAAWDAIEEVQSRFAWSRQGGQGRRRERAKLVVARFFHTRSRSGDVHLHWHQWVVNLAVAESGRITALAPIDKSLAPLLGQVFLGRLERILREELGLRTDRDPNNEFSFRLCGVPRELEVAASRRSHEIREELAARREYGAKAAQVAALKTRSPKGPDSRDELIRRTRKLATSLGYSPEEICAAAVTPEASALGESRTQPVDANGQDTYRGEQIVERASEELRSRSLRRLSPVAVRRAELLEASAALARREAFANLTTRVATGVGRLGESLVRVQRLARLQRMPSSSLTWKREDAAALLVGSKSRLQFVVGGIGTGKTSTIAGVAELYRNQGLDVTLLSASRLGKRVLEEAAGTSAMTLGSFLHRVKVSIPEKLGHHARQVAGAVGKRRGVIPLTVSARSVILLDGANLATLPDLNRLTQVATRTGARVVMAGRTSQISSEYQRLVEGVRARCGAALDPVVDFGSGPGEEQGALLSTGIREGRLPSVPSLVSQRIEADRRNEVEHQRLARLRLRCARVGDLQLVEGDRVLCKTDSKSLGLLAGDVAAVEQIKLAPRLLGGTVLTLRLDRSERRGLLRRPVRVEVPLARYPYFKLAHATTIRAAEGTAQERAWRAELDTGQPLSPDSPGI